MTNKPERKINNMHMTMSFTFAFIQLCLISLAIAPISVASAYTSPHLDRQAMAGVWRLRGKSNLPTTVLRYPMKEFTTYPKKPIPPPEEYLLMLKEDGSFQQYDEQQQPNKSWQIMANMRGTWDYRDGQLILAADRADNDSRQVHDTMLVGTVVAKSQESLLDNPVLARGGTDGNRDSDNNRIEKESNTQPSAIVETHLSVPKGAVKVGKFMYPKSHKMFFEQLMFKPLSMGSFELKQILGNLNAVVRKEENKLVERFRKSDFNNKKFLMTNFPIPERKRKGDLRWSIKYNKFVDDPIKKSKKDQDREANQTSQIRVMEVQLFPNNTFSTTAGLGDSTVLRGKWWIIGEERDQLWMQVWRFGFGRSVSGSTFSEGRMLSHDDAKSYWGRINHVEDDEVDGFDDDDDDDNDDSDRQQRDTPTATESNAPRRLQVKGSVIVGWGLEPQPVGRFIMREELEEEDYDEDDDDEDDDMDIEINSMSQGAQDGDDNIDWSSSFQ
ncbi:hypothetical protein MHU86_7865 [Fragilaria crotonensis]|nr:hypothetical protein MHU86_7865 [Fragilaria crotonensis]